MPTSFPAKQSMVAAAFTLALAASLVTGCKKSDEHKPVAKTVAAEPPAAAVPAKPAEPPAADSPNLAAAKEFSGILDEALAAAEATKGDCMAFGTKLDAIRTRLWDLGQAHPSALKQLSDAELKSVKTADKFDAMATHLTACSDNAHAKEFVFAMTKLL